MKLTVFVILCAFLAGCDSPSTPPAKVTAIAPIPEPHPIAPSTIEYLLFADVPMTAERLCDEIAYRRILYTLNVRPFISMKVLAIDYINVEGYRHYSGQLKNDVMVKKEWTTFDLENIPGTLLNQDLVPDVIRLSALVIEFDKRFHPSPDECTDRNGQRWLKVFAPAH